MIGVETWKPTRLAPNLTPYKKVFGSLSTTGTPPFPGCVSYIVSVSAEFSNPFFLDSIFFGNGFFGWEKNWMPNFTFCAFFLVLCLLCVFFIVACHEPPTDEYRKELLMGLSSDNMSDKEKIDVIRSVQMRIDDDLDKAMQPEGYLNVARLQQNMISILIEMNGCP